MAEVSDRGRPRSLVIYADAAVRGSPGEAGIGVVLCGEDGDALQEFGRFIGPATAQVAAYTAVGEALRAALALGATELRVLVGSDALAREVGGLAEVRKSALRPLLVEVRRLLLRFRRWTIDSVPSEALSRTAELANMSIDRQRNK